MKAILSGITKNGAEEIQEIQSLLMIFPWSKLFRFTEYSDEKVEEWALSLIMGVQYSLKNVDYILAGMQVCLRNFAHIHRFFFSGFQGGPPFLICYTD